MITTDLVGRIERMPLSPRNALLPLFEAVSNSIDAIRSREDGRSGNIALHVVRDTTQSQLALEVETVTEPVVEFRISDDGVGFTADNMTAFERLDTRIKMAIGGKGVGRLTWLKVFEKVTVNSIYRDGATYRKRSFDFTLPEGVENLSDSSTPSPQTTSTTVSMYRPKDPYRDATRHKPETIAAFLARHFLYYLLGQTPPKITVFDGATAVPVTTINVIARNTDEFEINTNKFSIEHLTIRSPQKAQHTVFYCANPGQRRALKAFT
jgi:hypothetical protein